MRILFTSTPGVGHVNPLIPLAQSLLRQGNDVRWATASDAVPTVEAAGIRAFGAGLASRDRHAEYHRRFPEWQQLEPQELPAHMFPRLFGEISLRPMLADLQSVVREWTPELIIHEVGEMAAPIVAATLGIPHVTEGFGARVRPERLRAAEAWTAPYWRSAGLDPRERCGSYEYLYLDIYPPGLDPGYDDDVGDHQLLRPVAIDTGAERSIAAWLEQPDERPLVYLTFGTVFNATSGVFAAAVEAIKALDVRALVTVGPRESLDAFGALPEHFLVAHYVPQHVTLQRADLVVSHAGSGTFLASLARGLPQLCLPQAADQFNNAAAGANSGAAISIEPQAATTAAIRAAVVALLSDPAYRVRARQVADDIAAMPAPDEVAAIITSRFGPNNETR
jgi:UDP:flavonoid glycosyltransferase YjiC (YdhE family)